MLTSFLEYLLLRLRLPTAPSRIRNHLLLRSTYYKSHSPCIFWKIKTNEWKKNFARLHIVTLSFLLRCKKSNSISHNWRRRKRHSSHIAEDSHTIQVVYRSEVIKPCYVKRILIFFICDMKFKRAAFTIYIRIRMLRFCLSGLGGNLIIIQLLQSFPFFL